MKVITKKSKESRMSDIDRAREYNECYSVVHVVENSDLPNKAIQEIRSSIDGKVLFVKKRQFQKKYPQCAYSQNFFLVFSKENVAETLGGVVYPVFAKAGDVASESVAIPAGTIKDQKLGQLVPTATQHGAVFNLAKDYAVCAEGDTLSEAQAALLQAMGRKLGTASVTVIDVLEKLQAEESEEKE